MAVPDLAEFERLGQVGRRDYRKPCKVAQAVEGLSAKERAVVLKGIVHESEDVRRGVKAWLAMEPRNVTLSVSSVRSHTQGTCKCNPLT